MEVSFSAKKLRIHKQISIYQVVVSAVKKIKTC